MTPSAVFLGIDLAWADGLKLANETGRVLLDSGGTVLEAGWTRGVDATVAWIDEHITQPDVLAFVGASLVVNNPVRTQRLCEKQVGQRYGRWKVSANSTNVASRGRAGAQLLDRLRTGLAVRRRLRRATGVGKARERLLPVRGDRRCTGARLRRRAPPVQAPAPQDARRPVEAAAGRRLRRLDPTVGRARHRRPTARPREPYGDAAVARGAVAAGQQGVQAPGRPHRRGAVRVDRVAVGATRTRPVPGARGSGRTSWCCDDHRSGPARAAPSGHWRTAVLVNRHTSPATRGPKS